MSRNFKQPLVCRLLGDLSHQPAPIVNRLSSRLWKPQSQFQGYWRAGRQLVPSSGALLGGFQPQSPLLFRPLLSERPWSMKTCPTWLARGRWVARTGVKRKGIPAKRMTKASIVTATRFARFFGIAVLTITTIVSCLTSHSDLQFGTCQRLKISSHMIRIRQSGRGRHAPTTSPSTRSVVSAIGTHLLPCPPTTVTTFQLAPERGRSSRIGSVRSAMVSIGRISPCTISPCFNGTEEERRCPDYDGRVGCSPLRWRPKNGTYRRYYLRLTTRCLTGAIVPDAMRRACQFNRNFRIVSGIDRNGVLVNYKNRFCAQCNGAKSIRCGPVRIDNKPVVRNNPRNRLLVKINPSLVQCPRGKVYDPQSKACHEAATEKASAPALRRYRIVLHISSGARLSENGATQELRQPFKDALNYSFGIPPYHIANTLAMRSVDPGNKTIVVFELDWPLKRQQRENVLELDAILNFTRPFYVRISNQTHVVSNSSARLLACAQYETFATHEYTVIPRDEPVVYINGSGEVFHRYQYYSAQTTRKNCQEHPVDDVYVCRLYLKDGCQGVPIPLKRGEYTVLPTGAIYRHGSHETIELEAYDLRQGTVWICTKPSRESGETVNRAYLILLYVGLAVSVACLLAALVLHGLLANLRASLGVDTVNICASLLLQQSLYFVTWRVDGLMACSIVAILIHYFTLASFNWLAVIAWRAFRSTTPQPTGQQNPSVTPKTGSVTCSVAIAWLAPVVFIIMSLVLAASGIFPCAVGFGAPEACLMPQVSANVLLYLPIGMSLAVTVVLLAKGAFKRRKARVQAEDGVAPDVTSPLPEVTGLAVLMGATWICAFLGRVVSEKLVYPFMVLNSLHGVYLLVAFTLKPSLCGRARCCADDAQQPNVELTGVRSRRTVPSPVDTEM